MKRLSFLLFLVSIILQFSPTPHTALAESGKFCCSASRRSCSDFGRASDCAKPIPDGCLQLYSDGFCSATDIYGPGSSGGGSTCNPKTEICNPIQAKTFYDLVVAIAKAITAIGIPLVAIFLVWAGFLFVTSRGNEEQLKRAKTTFFWTLVGGAVLIGAWALSVAIVNFARNLGGTTNNPLPNNANLPVTPPSVPNLPIPI